MTVLFVCVISLFQDSIIPPVESPFPARSTVNISEGLKRAAFRAGLRRIARDNRQHWPAIRTVLKDPDLFDIVYGADLVQVEPPETAKFASDPSAPVLDFLRDLIQAMWANRQEIIDFIIQLIGFFEGFEQTGSVLEDIPELIPTAANSPQIGPSQNSVVRVTYRGSCGSGSICGIRPGGKALILTNAHVISGLGRIANIDVEATGDRIRAKVIMFAYSRGTISDWAILETLDPYTKVSPVKLSIKTPTGSHYSDGFPRCQAFDGQIVRTVSVVRGLWKWRPNAIGGQSGSGVWSQDDDLCYGLVTWTINGLGAGQTTQSIWESFQSRRVSAVPRPEGLKELAPGRQRGLFLLSGEGFYSVVEDITTLPIWAHLDEEPDPPSNTMLLEFLKDLRQFAEGWIDRLSA